VILYPRLERTDDLVARAIELGGLSVEQCRARRRTADSAAVYTATGGTRSSVAQLEAIVKGLTDIAVKNGYPEERQRNTSADAQWAEWLHRHLNTSAHEAALDSIWHFFTVVLVPDLVRWRWGATKEDSTSDRWVTIKHRGRNAFGRLWWRAEVFYDEDSESPYHLVHALGEDELVQVMERPSFAGNRTLSTTTAKVLLRVEKENPDFNRSSVLRDYQKRMLRLGAFTDFQALDAKATTKLAQEVMERTLKAIQVGYTKKPQSP
jgi:hypothetical protein